MAALTSAAVEPGGGRQTPGGDARLTWLLAASTTVTVPFGSGSA